MEDEMMEGYLDHWNDTLVSVTPALGNRSAAYIHGWLNARDDRLGQPRRSAEELRVRAEAIRSNPYIAPEATETALGSPSSTQVER